MSQAETPKPTRDCYAWWLREGASIRRWYDANEDAKYRDHTGAVLVQVRKLAERIIAESMPREPVAVLEFGCGNGRHLKAINSALPVVSYGFDISPGIVDETVPNVRIGHPCEPLTYVTGEFDIVFTCTSLIHVHPEDLPGVLDELIRVTATGGTLLHFEPQKKFDFAEDHGGTWGLDLCEAYRKLGFAAEYVDEKPFGFWRVVKPSVAEFVTAAAAEEAWNEAGDAMADMLMGKPGSPVTVEERDEPEPEREVVDDSQDTLRSPAA